MDSHAGVPAKYSSNIIPPHLSMKISCEREKFSQAFQLVASVAAAKDVKPVLQNVKISTTKKNVLLQATDTEIGIRLHLDGCEVQAKGDAVLPTKVFKKMLQESTEPMLLIESEQEKVHVSGAKGRLYGFPTQSADEFPDVEDFSAASYHEVSTKVLREIIRRTVFAIDTEHNRYNLDGVLLEFIEDKIIGVATDGKRLAFQEGTAQCVGDHKAENTIFPAKALHILERSLGSDDEVVQVSVSTNRALFRCGNVVFFTRLVEGRFPRWRTIIPETEGKVQIDVLAGALNTAVRQAAIVTSERQPGVIFSFSSGKLVLNAHGAELGDASIEVPLSYSGDEQNVKLDPKFFTDYLRVFESEKNLSIYISGDDPIHIRTDDAYIYVVMPMS